MRMWTSPCLQKSYGTGPSGEKRYSPAVCLGCKVEEVTGSPDPKHISTSSVVRQNLTMGMSMRRFTLLTNAFSKKIENHAAAVALCFMFYNFVRVRQTLPVTLRWKRVLRDGRGNHWAPGLGGIALS